MKLGIKIKELTPYFILLSVVIIDLIIWGGLISIFGTSSTIISGILSFVGSIIGGLITLVGVLWTLNAQKRQYNKEKYDKANYIFTELLPKINKVHFHIKSLRPDSEDFLNRLDLLEGATIELEEKTIKLVELSVQTDIEFFRNVKQLEFYCSVIIDYLDDLIGIEPEEEVFDNLMRYRTGIAKADASFDKLLSDMNNTF